MKRNDEDFFQFEKKKNGTRLLKKVTITFIVIFLIFNFLAFISIFTMKSYYDFSKEVFDNGQKYEKSIYIKYKNKIYANIYGEAYQLKNVDIESFKVIDSTDYSDSYIAADKNSVYFGNIPAPDLNPEKFEVIGNGYYTDGKNNYFCQRYSEKNENLSKFEYIKYFLLMGDRPQRYIYPFKKVEMNRSLQVIKDISFFTTDGKKVYYKGEILENADINTFGVVDSNSEYFFDKENVYYKTKILPVKNSGNLEIVSIDQGHNFLYDRRNGYVFLEDYPFDMEKAPYRVLGNKGNHIYDLLFVNNEGVYFYDDQAKKQKRAGDNIFVGKIEEVNPNVFTDDRNIYYLQSYDVKKRKKNIGSYADILVSKNIGVFYLGEKKNWEKIKDIDSGIIGQVWKENNKYYYFDNLGEHQIVDNVIYEISDEGTLQELLNSENISSDKIREIINTKKLLPIRGKEVLTAAVKYKRSYEVEIFLTVFLTIFFVGKHFVLKKFKKLENMKEETDYYEL